MFKVSGLRKRFEVAGLAVQNQSKCHTLPA
ncbi:hypothetical protein HDF11_002838 [Tunturiibacter psychrotolerans]